MNIIAENISEILQHSADVTAPVKQIQLTSKNTVKLSIEAKQALVDRDLAHTEAKHNPTPENIREHKNLRNKANTLISKERYLRKRMNYEETLTMKQKWKLAKIETGQSIQTSPTQIIDGQKTYLKPREIAGVLNRQYLTKIEKQ